MSAGIDELTFFDRIHLAHCAMERASLHVRDEHRFTREYETARKWHNYKCVINNRYSYVENYK